MQNKILFFFICFSWFSANSQTVNYQQEFDKVLNGEYSLGYSKKRISSKSKRNNAHHFLEIGYFINANNIAGNPDASYEIIQNIIKESNKKNDVYSWTVTKISANDKNASQKGKEFMLFEGYMFRYIAEFQFLYPNKILEDQSFVKKNFLKWYERSYTKHGDLSSLFGLRLHIGSHWATIASFLMKLDPVNSKVYEEVVNTFDHQLKKSIKVVKVNGHECYVWNSTYSEKFLKNLRNRNIVPQVQDVSHGNHIIQYVYDSYRLGSKTWTTKDLDRFRNTLKYIIWNNKKIASDYVDGTYAKQGHTGWKQSDGWMKLLLVLNDEALYEIYDEFYSINSNKIKRNYPDIQFYAIMSVLQNNKK